MLVAIMGFGRVWRHRLGSGTDDGCHSGQPVYYNTTGIVAKGKVRQRPRICGYARFDAVGGFNPNHLSKMVDRVFECAEPSVWMGCNKLLFKRILKVGQRPDGFLVVARSELIGHLAVGTEGWRSTDSWLLAFSDCAEQQEAMLLITAGGWIQSGFGRFVLESSERRPWVARLVLTLGQ